MLGGRRWSWIDRPLATETVGSAGHVLATDMTDDCFSATSGNISFRHHDVAHDTLPERGFDLVHARFLLEHLAEPRRAIRQLVNALRPGGVLMLEDPRGSVSTSRQASGSWISS